MEKIESYNKLNENITNNLNNFKIDYKKLLNFDPTNRDGLVMFGLYICIVMFLLKKYTFGVCFGCISIFLYFSKKEPVKEVCRESSTDNPYQNLLWENDGMKACNTNKKKQQDNFEENLYRNETDLFNRKSMQASYYTIEESYPNDIRELKKSMDSRGRCKAEGINCVYPSFFLN